MNTLQFTFLKDGKGQNTRLKRRDGEDCLSDIRMLASSA